jgi:hypothetical protein
MYTGIAQPKMLKLALLLLGLGTLGQTQDSTTDTTMDTTSVAEDIETTQLTAGTETTAIMGDADSEAMRFNRVKLAVRKRPPFPSR